MSDLPVHENFSHGLRMTDAGFAEWASLLACIMQTLNVTSVTVPSSFLNSPLGGKMEFWADTDGAIHVDIFDIGPTEETEDE